MWVRLSDAKKISHWTTLRNSPLLLGVPFQSCWRNSQVASDEKRLSDYGFEPDCDIDKLQALLPYIEKYQALASSHGIFDIFQDNGGKLLQVLLLLGIEALPEREGNDAVDAQGNEYELKSVNRYDMRGKRRSSPSFTTHHHLNPVVLAKYRQVDWIFAVYSSIELEAIYLLTPQKLEPYFTKWEEDYKVKGDLNNPKISIRFVEENGLKLHPDS